MLKRILEKNTDYEVIFNSGELLPQWESNNVPDKNLIYRKGCFEQIREMGAVSVLIDNIPRVVGYHSSKSVKLPVSCFRFFEPSTEKKAYAFVRKNFYDVKCCVKSDVPIEIPMEFAHREVDDEWIENEIKVYTEYKNVPRPEGNEWYSKWSSGHIVEYKGRLYRASKVDRCYCEGICDIALPGDVFSVYQPGMYNFSLSTYSTARLVFLLECIKKSVEEYGYTR